MTFNSAVLTFDEILTQYIGDFGRGQKLIVLIVSVLAIPNGLISLLWVMMTIDPIKNHHWQCVDPSDATCNAVYVAPSSQDFCDLPADTWHWTNSDSLVSRFNLICSDNWKVQLANSLYFIGCFLGSGLFGALSDHIGRKRPMLIATAILAVATLLNAAAPNCWFISVMRLVAGMGAAGQVQGILLLCMESTGRSARGIAAGAEVVAFCIGEYILTALAVLVPNWRSLTLAAGTICALGLLLYPLIPESARWLLSQQGKEEQALKILHSIAIRNGSRLPAQHLLPCSSSSKTVHSSCSVSDLAQQQRQQQSSSGMAGLQISDCPTNQSNITPHDCYFAAHFVQNNKSIAGFSRRSSNDVYCNIGSNDISSSNDKSVTAAADSNSIKFSNKHTDTETAAVGTTVNNKTVDNSLSAEDASDTDSAAESVTLLQLLRQPALAAMSAVMVLTWFANFHTFYVISLGTGGLPGSIHVTFALNVTGQLIATILAGALVDRLGRHNIISFSLLVGGVACLTCATITNKTAQIVLATIGQFGCTASLAVAPTYTAELYPTSVRSTTLGICNKASRLGCLSAPFMILLGASAGGGSSIFLPYTVCGSACLTAGLLVLFMPETLGKDMPEKMGDLQQLQTVFTAKPWRDGGCLATAAFLFRRRATVHSQARSKIGQSEGAGSSFRKDVESQHRTVNKSGGSEMVNLSTCEGAALTHVDHG